MLTPKPAGGGKPDTPPLKVSSVESTEAIERGLAESFFISSQIPRSPPQDCTASSSRRPKATSPETVTVVSKLGSRRHNWNRERKRGNK